MRLALYLTLTAAFLLNAGLAALWTAWLLWPEWAMFTTSPTFALMALVFGPHSEVGWAWVMGGLVAGWLVSLVVPRAAIVAFAASIFVWAVIGLLFIQANVQSVAGPTYFIIALTDVPLALAVRWLSGQARGGA